LSESADRLKIHSVKTSLMHRCFLGIYGVHENSDFAEIYMDWENEAKWHLLREEPLTEQEVIQKFKNGEIQYCSEMGLIHKSENLAG
jgi:hypothetical protein